MSRRDLASKYEDAARSGRRLLLNELEGVQEAVGIASLKELALSHVIDADELGFGAVLA